MKALSLSQPYAELVVRRDKTIEIRSWNTNFRGQFYIHASKRTIKDDCEKFGFDPDKLPTGMLVGKAKIVSVIKYNTIKDFQKDYPKHRAGDKWFKKAGDDHQSKCYGFILEGAERLEKYIPTRGMLNFFDVGAPSTE